MGKRSNFERIERDFYPTPLEAVRPLVPHLLPGPIDYIEPCAGDGALIKHLRQLLPGHIACYWASDLDPRGPDIEKMDALNPNRVLPSVHYVITNPPWDRKLLHRMIREFIKWAPTWLLFDADWMHTAQAIPYLEHCRKVVSIGRVKWFPGSDSTGKENCCWYLFTKEKGPTEFYGRVAAPACPGTGELFESEAA